MEKKDISAKVAVKGLVNGFIAYGFLIGFLVFSLIVFVNWQVNQYKEYIDYDTLKYSLPLLASFLIYFLVRRICQLSTYDLFQKCKIKKEDVENVSSKMNLFFIGCVVFFVIVIILILTIRFNNEKININHTRDVYYTEYSESFAEYLTAELIYNFQIQRITVLIQTVIMEVGLLAGLFSLISAQKKYIERYNFTPQENNTENSKLEETAS